MSVSRPHSPRSSIISDGGSSLASFVCALPQERAAWVRVRAALQDKTTLLGVAVSLSHVELAAWAIARGACLQGTSTAVQAAVSSFSKNSIRKVPGAGKSPRGTVKTCEIVAKNALIKQQTKKSRKNFAPTTPLHIAAKRGREAMVALLLKHGASPLAKDELDRTPLYLAAANGHASITKLFCLHFREQSFPPRGPARDTPHHRSRARTPLHAAAVQGHAGAIQGHDAHFREQSFRAVGYPSFASNPSMYDRSSSSADAPLEERSRENEFCAAVLLNASSEALFGRTPLHAAAIQGHAAVVSVLLQFGADLSAPADGGRTPLHCAAGKKSKRHAETVAAMLSANEDHAQHHSQRHAVVNRRDLVGRTALHDACRWGNVEAVHSLLQAGAEVDSVDDKLRTPLFLACSSKNYSDGSRLAGTIALLLAHGCEPMRRSPGPAGGLSPLHVLAANPVWWNEDSTPVPRQQNHAMTVATTALVRAGFNTADTAGRFPLHAAVLLDNRPLVTALVRAGVDVNARTHAGFRLAGGENTILRQPHSSKTRAVFGVTPLQMALRPRTDMSSESGPDHGGGSDRLGVVLALLDSGRCHLDNYSRGLLLGCLGQVFSAGVEALVGVAGFPAPMGLGRRASTRAGRTVLDRWVLAASALMVAAIVMAAESLQGARFGGKTIPRDEKFWWKDNTEG